MKAKRVWNLIFAALATPTVAFAGTTAWVGNKGDDSISIIDVSDIDGDQVVDEVLFTIKPMCTNCVPGQICNPNILVPCINGPHDIAFSPDGHWAYVTAYDGDRLAVIDASPLLEEPPEAPIFASRTNTGLRPQGVAVSADGYYAYVANSSSDNVGVFEVSGGFASLLTTVAVGNDPNGITVTPDGSEVWVTNNLSDSVSVITTDGHTVLHTVEVGSAPRRVIVADIPNEGLQAYTVNARGDSVSVIDADATTPSEIDTIDVDDVVDPDPQTSQPRGMALHPDKDRLFVTEFVSVQLTKIFTSDNSKASPLTVAAGSPHRIAVTPDGTKAYIANPDDDCVSIYNVETDQILELPIPVENGPGAVAVLVQVPE